MRNIEDFCGRKRRRNINKETYEQTLNELFNSINSSHFAQINNE